MNLCTVQAVCSACIVSWATVLQRHMWLQISPSIPDEIKKELLQGPIIPD